MRSLVGLGHDENLFDIAVLDLSGRAVLFGPFMRRPWRAGFVRIWVFVVLALERERLVAPRQLEDLEDLLEHLAVGLVDLGLVGGGGRDVKLLSHLVEPAMLVAAREANEGASLGELV